MYFFIHNEVSLGFVNTSKYVIILSDFILKNTLYDIYYLYTKKSNNNNMNAEFIKLNQLITSERNYPFYLPSKYILYMSLK